MSWRSSLEVWDMARGRARVVLRTPRLIEAPNWHPEGWFLVNGAGRLWRTGVEGEGLRPLETGCAERCNNDHGILPDGRIAFSAHDGTGAGMHLWDGARLERVAVARPSWWHGATRHRLVYACARGADRVVRIATCAVSGAGERVLTPGRAHHDGPDVSACGGWIWFNSDATGHAQIWRMRMDGSEAAPVFRDARVNWFPHPSPCGRHVIWLSYAPGTAEHPRDRQVQVHAMAPDGTGRRVLFSLFGGQGTMNVPCWAPDGGAFAYMRYAPEV